MNSYLDIIQLTVASIRHSFCYAGLCNNQTVERDQYDREENILSEWISQFNIPSKFQGHIRKYKNIDEDVATTSSFTDEQIGSGGSSEQ